MSKRMPAIMVTLAALLLAGCSGDVVTGTPHDALIARSANSVSVSRPFKGDCDLVSRGLVFTGPTTATQIVEGTCNMTHLGRSEILINETINFIGLSFSSVATITAANGDELYVTFNGLATPSAAGLGLAGTMLVTGGTGRFTNASGSAAHTGLVTGTATYHLEGRLVY